MTPTTTTAESLDHLDPWGFGRAGTDDRTAVVEYFEPLDEPVDDDEPILVDLPGLSLPASYTRAARAASQPLPGPDDRGRRLPFPTQMLGVLGVFAAVIMAQAFYIGFSLTGEASARPEMGEAVISSHPTGAPVLVDGRLQGTTPVVLPLTAGRHRVEVLSASGDPERLQADVIAGQRWARHVVLAATASPGARLGALRVDTGRVPAQVLIDGALAGTTPFSRADLAAGDHAVRVEFHTGAVIERTITVPARETVSLVLDAPLPAPARAPIAAAPAAGWVRVNASFEVQVFEAGQLVGSSTTDRIMLTPGGHALELVNTALGFRTTLKTVVVPGKLVPLALDTPRVPVAINAQPWAEVVVDGRVHGETPLANLMLPIGEHEIVLRHPDLGERIETVTVRATGANRVSADLRR